MPGPLASALLQVRNLGGTATQPLTTLPDYNKSVCYGIGDGCKHKANASLHLATVKHHASIKAHQCRMCLYLICGTTMNVREWGATPLVTPLSTLYNKR